MQAPSICVSLYSLRAFQPVTAVAQTRACRDFGNFSRGRCRRCRCCCLSWQSFKGFPTRHGSSSNRGLQSVCVLTIFAVAQTRACSRGCCSCSLRLLPEPRGLLLYPLSAQEEAGLVHLQRFGRVCRLFRFRLGRASLCSAGVCCCCCCLSWQSFKGFPTRHGSSSNRGLQSVCVLTIFEGLSNPLQQWLKHAPAAVVAAAAPCASCQSLVASCCTL